MNISSKWPQREALQPGPIRYLLWRLHSWTDLLWQLRCHGPIKETSLLNNCNICWLDSFGPYLQQESMVSPVQQLYIKIQYIFLLIYHTLNTCFIPPGHLYQVVCEEDRQRLQPTEPWIALTITIRDSRHPSHGLLSPLPSETPGTRAMDCSHRYHQRLQPPEPWIALTLPSETPATRAMDCSHRYHQRLQPPEPWIALTVTIRDSRHPSHGLLSPLPSETPATRAMDCSHRYHQRLQAPEPWIALTVTIRDSSHPSHGLLSPLPSETPGTRAMDCSHRYHQRLQPSEPWIALTVTIRDSRHPSHGLLSPLLSETPATRAMDCSHHYRQADVITEPSPADCKTSSFHRQSDWTELIPLTPYTAHNLICTALYHFLWLDSDSLLFCTLTFCLQ